MKQCLLCLDFTKQTFCAPCVADLPWVNTYCPRCGRASPTDYICKPCQSKPVSWDIGVAPLLYQTPIPHMLWHLKFYRKLHYAEAMSRLFIQAHPQIERPDILIPVPLHPRRMISRGFNQSTELCRALSRHLNIPYRTRHIKRIKHTPSQRQLGKRSRKHNLRDAFALHKPIPAKHIALVDDVLTTGETFDSICKMLREHSHVERIDVWAMAQTPSPSLKEALRGNGKAGGPPVKPWDVEQKTQGASKKNLEIHLP